MPPAAAKERSPRDVLVSVRSIERPDGSSKFVVDVKDDARGAGKLAASLSGASEGDKRDGGVLSAAYWGEPGATAAVAGMISGLFFFVNCVVLSKVIFSGPLSKEGQDAGLKSAMLGGIAAQVLNSCFSSLDTSVVVPWVVLPFILPAYEKMEEDMIAAGHGKDEVVATIMMCNAIIPVVSGVALFAMAVFKLGKLLNFIPQTVLTGAFACFGYALWLVGFSLACGEKFTITEPDKLGWLGDSDQLPKWVLAQLLGVGLFAARTAFPQYTHIIFPVYFVGGVIAVNIGMFVTASSDSITYGADNRWLFETIEGGHIDSYFSTFFSLDNVKWSYIVKGDMVSALWQAAAFGPVMNVPINVLALGTLTGKDFEANYEISISALANVLGGFLGGFTHYISVADTKLHMLIGGTTRWSTLLVGVLLALFMFLPWTLEIVRIIPQVVLAGKFVDLGVYFLYAAGLAGRTLKTKEFLNIWLMLVVSIVFSITTAIMMGLVIAFFFFIAESSSTKNIEFDTDGSVLTSDSIRTLKVTTMLSVLGRLTRVVKLKGEIFFATSAQIRELFKRITANAQTSGNSKPMVRYVVIDIADVTQMDSSTILLLPIILKDLMDAGAERVVISGIADFVLNHNMKAMKQIRIVNKEYIASGFLELREDMREVLGELENLILYGNIQGETSITSQSTPVKTKSLTSGKTSKAFERMRRSAFAHMAIINDVNCRRCSRAKRSLISLISVVEQNACVVPEAKYLYYFPMFGEWTYKSYKKGHTLTRAGSPSHGVWILIRGSVSAEFTQESSSELMDRADEMPIDESDNLTEHSEAPGRLKWTASQSTMHKHEGVLTRRVKVFTGCGALLGVSGLSTSTSRYFYTFRALEDVEAYYISRDNMNNMLEKHCKVTPKAQLAALAIYRLGIWQSQRQQLETKMLLLAEMQSTSADAMEDRLEAMAMASKASKASKTKTKTKTKGGEKTGGSASEHRAANAEALASMNSMKSFNNIAMH